MTAQPRALAGLVAVLLAIVGVTAVRLPERAAAAETSCPSGIALQNGDFEAPAVPAGPGRDVADSDAAAAWHTTATDHQIEYWSDGAGVAAANGNRPISAESGRQWVELNATQASTLYQDLATVPGQVMRWSLWHRARYTGAPGGQDVMRVLVGSTSTQVQQGADISDGPDAWVNYTGSYVVPPGQTITRFAFKAVSTSSGNTTVGNFLDDVVFSNAPCLTADAAVTNLDRASGGLTRPGDHLRYAVSVRNTGGDDASDTVVSDTIPAGTTYVPGSLTVDGSAVSDAADGDGGEVSGGQVTGRPGVVGAGATTTVAFEVTVDPGTTAGTTLSDDPGATYTWAPDPAPYDAVADPVTSTVATTGLTVATSLTGTTDVDGDGRLDTGDRVGFAFAVTDTGSVDLASVAVTARSATGPLSVDCPSGPLAAGASETCTASYRVVQGDVDGGAATVTATAGGTPPSGAAGVTSDPSTASQPLDRSSALALSVTGPVTDANADGVTDLGDVVTWTFRLANTGTVTLSQLAVDDPAAGQIDCAATTLAAGDSTTCTATHAVTSAEVAAGKVSTTGSARGLDPEGDSVTAERSGVEVPVTIGSALTLVATSTTADVDGDFRVDLGDQVTWSYQVTNTGSTTLTDVAVDAPTSGPVSCPDSTLAPGASTLCTTAAHVIAQADVDAGSVSSTGTASATGGDGHPVTTDPSSATVPVAQTSAVQLSTATAVTDVNQDGRTDPGDVVDWTFLVTNTGTTTLDLAGRGRLRRRGRLPARAARTRRHRDVYRDLAPGHPGRRRRRTDRGHRDSDGSRSRRSSGHVEHVDLLDSRRSSGCPPAHRVGRGHRPRRRLPDRPRRPGRLVVRPDQHRDLDPHRPGRHGPGRRSRVLPRDDPRTRSGRDLPGAHAVRRRPGRRRRGWCRADRPGHRLGTRRLDGDVEPELDDDPRGPGAGAGRRCECLGRRPRRRRHDRPGRRRDLVLPGAQHRHRHAHRDLRWPAPAPVR